MSGRFLYQLLLGIGMLLCTTTLHAQDEYEEAPVDSIIAPPPLQEEEHVTYQEKKHDVEPPAFRAVPDSVTHRLKKQKDFAYANDPAYWTNEPEEEEDAAPHSDFWDHFNSFFGQDGVRMLMFGLLIAFFLFIIYRVVVVNNLFMFYRSKKINKAGEEGEGDIEDDNLDEKIIKAIDQKEYRLAVRYMYLKSLRLLNDRQWIRYNAQATNYEYVSQMSGHKMAEEFRFLTVVYDYVWYGEFTLTNEQFDIVQKNFQHFFNAVK